MNFANTRRVVTRAGVCLLATKREPGDIAIVECYCSRSDTTEAEKRKMHEPPTWSRWLHREKR